MNQDQWPTSTAPHAMLEFLLSKRRPSDRKMRLFACACCRRIWRLLEDERSRQAVEVAEEYADGNAAMTDLASLQDAADAAYFEAIYARDQLAQQEGYQATSLGMYRALLAEGACDVARGPVQVAADDAARFGLWHVLRCCRSTAVLLCGASSGREMMEHAQAVARDADEQIQASILRCIFGNPFRPLPPLPTAAGDLITQLASAAYEDRILPEGRLDNARLAVLADALEEAGFEDAEMLRHLRQPDAVHVRGCAVVDYLLNRS